MRFKLATCIGFGALLVATSAMPANAATNTGGGQSSDPRRISRGDAEAVFQAAGTGGQMLILHTKVSPGAPNPDPLRASIRPIVGSQWDGAHFCQEDWHVILQGDVEGGDKSFTKQDAQQIMDGIQIVLTLDGKSLQTTRTAIKRFTNPEARGFQEAWWFAEGRLMAPTDLGVGSHQLDLTESDPSGQVDQHGITFYIDAAGTGACV